MLVKTVRTTSLLLSAIFHGKAHGSKTDLSMTANLPQELILLHIYARSGSVV